jgi:hypothetical protein
MVEEPVRNHHPCPLPRLPLSFLLLRSLTFLLLAPLALLAPLILHRMLGFFHLALLRHVTLPRRLGPEPPELLPPWSDSAGLGADWMCKTNASARLVGAADALEVDICRRDGDGGGGCVDGCVDRHSLGLGQVF